METCNQELLTFPCTFQPWGAFGENNKNSNLPILPSPTSPPKAHRIRRLNFCEIGNLVKGIEPPIPVVDIHNVLDGFSLILYLIKAYDEFWLSNPSDDPSLTISPWALHEK
ncbi:hypothetical protein VP01_3482g4 [Puccinia sorghi]|uniref:Uncharacterized protein n=1 Tax=Puccinia sorghi TaxID=27349 RepID=A0A0L6UXT2_9BASI|nr:hypothetical protein VP01_3482g4 [Puccinia sorghi]